MRKTIRDFSDDDHGGVGRVGPGCFGRSECACSQDWGAGETEWDRGNDLQRPSRRPSSIQRRAR